jgi:hypothetical protein
MVRLIMTWMLLGFFALIENSAFLDGSFRQNIVLILHQTFADEKPTQQIR